MERNQRTGIIWQESEHSSTALHTRRQCSAGTGTAASPYPTLPTFGITMAKCRHPQTPLTTPLLKVLPRQGGDSNETILLVRTSSNKHLPSNHRKRRVPNPLLPLSSKVENLPCRHSPSRVLWDDKKESVVAQPILKVAQAFPVKMTLLGLLLMCMVTSTEGQTQNTSPPTRAPTPAPISLAPSPVPSTAQPTASATTTTPTLSSAPSRTPSATPSLLPTISHRPSATPSIAPTQQPSVSPTDLPTDLPSFAEAFEDAADFRMTLLIHEPREEFNDTETTLLEDLLISYTDVFAPSAIDVDTSCFVQDQSLVDCSASNPLCTAWGVNVSDPDSLVGYLNDIDFRCEYSSRVSDVTGFPDQLALYTDQNLDLITDQMINLGLPVIRANAASTRTDKTALPTLSPVEAPTVSPVPTLSPVETTEFPTFEPRDTGVPTSTPSPSGGGGVPLPPTAVPSSGAPTIAPRGDGGSSNNNGLIVGVVLSIGGVALVGLFLYYRQRKKARSQAMGLNNTEISTKRSFRPSESSSRRNNANNNTAAAAAERENGASGGGGGGIGGFDPEAIPLSPSDASKNSLISRPSLLGDESDAEDDGTKKIQDEFDKYRDENLDKLRSEVEGNMPGFEGVMSAAVMRVLMGNDESEEITPEVTWGCSGSPTGAEIEASALCEVNDWLKRHEGGTLEQKRSFMQDILNRMVTSVRLGVVNSEDASRTIHESAALLGLQLANELPMTTVIISGMRKTAAASHMISVLKEFGVIDVAAVASKQKGFGIVRFRHPRAVDRVMRRYRSSEIVIQDVAVQIKALMPSGDVQGRG